MQESYVHPTSLHPRNITIHIETSTHSRNTHPIAPFQDPPIVRSFGSKSDNKPKRSLHKQHADGSWCVPKSSEGLSCCC